MVQHSRFTCPGPAVCSRIVVRHGPVASRATVEEWLGKAQLVGVGKKGKGNKHGQDCMMLKFERLVAGEEKAARVWMYGN
ncbi:hypothetical protein GUJ93_ZPchr0006g45517 [Zizania palustris]|uniref:Uncharacterized protein n=1 Tax=Zizania palustris TaxID=103762 RepID=A0A8J5W4U8_ZIZPA|nr:hypothetical protein GUJ93_ZPchr0006g45517 [Zizania palustris]